MEWMSDLEHFWADILSEDPDRIHNAAKRLTQEEQRHLIHHLERMSTEAGWQEGQRRRSRTALLIISHWLEGQQL